MLVRHKLSWKLCGSFSTEGASLIPGVHMCLYTWRPLTTLVQKYNRSPAINIFPIMLGLASRNNFSFFNAGLVLTPGPKPPEENKRPSSYSRQYGICTFECVFHM